MEMISTTQTTVIPLWQILAFLGALTLCTLARKSIGMVIVSFLFAIHWVFWQHPSPIKSEGQEYTLMAIFFGLGLLSAFAIAWNLYRADHYE